MKLTRCQQIIYNSEKYIGGSISVTCGIMTVDKSVPEDKLISAVREIYRTNYSLNLKLTETADGPELIYCSPEGRAIETVRVGDKAELEAIGNRISVEPFDLSAWLSELFPVIFPGGYGIIVKFHHIIGDAASMSLIGTQLNELLEGKTSERYSYEEYSAAEEKYLSGPRYEKDRLFFIEEYKKCKEPVLFFENSGENYKTKKLTCNIPRELCGRLTAFSEENNIPEYTCLLSALAFTYSRLRNYPEAFFIGIPTDSRVTAANAKTVGMFTNPLPLRIEPDCEKTLKENAAAIQNSLFTLLKHQKFSFSDLQKTLKDEFGFTGKLYDCSFNYQPDIISSDWNMSSKEYYRDVQSENIQFFFNKRNGEKGYVVDVVYRKSVVSDSKARTIYDSFLICLSSLINDDIRLKDIEFTETLSESAYKPQNAAEEFKSVLTAIRESAAEHPHKTAVTTPERQLTYGELSAESNSAANALKAKGIGPGKTVAFCLSRTYRIFPAILGILKTGAAYLPIDAGCPADRIDYMINDSGAALCLTDNNIDGYLTFPDTSDVLYTPDSRDICYIIYTSGSTGKPKGVKITHGNAANYCSGKEGSIYSGIIASSGCSSVLSVTSVSFDIFVTESLLPLSKGMEIVMADDIQSENQNELTALLKTHPADLIQTTPTKIKMLTGDKNNLSAFLCFKALMIGGEVFSPDLFNELGKLCPARIFNVYGPTETTVWVTYKEITCPGCITIGKPVANTEIHIVDRFLNEMPAGFAGQIAVSGKSTCPGYVNDTEKTDSVFVDNPFGEGKLYLTGDLGYMREDGDICFIGRNDFQVKIHGQRIEPGEIEAALTAIGGVENAAVTVRSSQSGEKNLFAFYSGKELLPSELRKNLSLTLPKYMIPAGFIHLEKLPLTSSGKTDRKALAGLEINTIISENDYIPPETDAEKLVCSLSEKILNAGPIGLKSSFAEFGGDSIKAIELVSALEKEGCTVSARKVISADSMKQLAASLEPVSARKTKENVPGPVPASSVQKEIYLAQSAAPDVPLYNITYVLKASQVNKEKLQAAVDGILEKYDILRTSFEYENGVLIQKINRNVKCEIEDTDAEPGGFIRPFDMGKAPLLRVGIKENTLIFDLHHIIADGLSMPVFFKELNALYSGRESGITPKQYADFAGFEDKGNADGEYWAGRFANGVPDFDFPFDFPRKSPNSHAGKTVYHYISAELTDKISSFCKENGFTPFEFWFSAYQVLLYRLTGNDDAVIGVPFSTRNAGSIDAIGNFAATLPVLCHTDCEKESVSFIENVSGHLKSDFEHPRVTCSELSLKLKVKDGLFFTFFTYQDKSTVQVEFGDEILTPEAISQNVSKYDFDFTVYPVPDGAVTAVTYRTDLFKPETAGRMADAFEIILSAMTEKSTVIKDISVLGEKDRHIITEANSTDAGFPDSSMYSLFEKQLKLDPDRICIRDKSCSYSMRRLDADARKTDAFIRERTGGKKQVIGLICDRSYLEIALIFGIVRSGCAYLPISPDYPAQRIKDIINTAGCSLVIAQKEYLSLCDCAVSPDEILREDAPVTDFPSLAVPDDLLYVIFTSGSTGKPKGASVTNRSAVNRINWMAKRYFDGNTVVMLKTPYTFDVSVWEIFGFAAFGFSIYILPPDAHYDQAQVLDCIAEGGVTDIHFVPSIFNRFLSVLGQSGKAEALPVSLKNVFLSGEVLTAAQVNTFNKYHNGRIGVHNLYGPAECAVDVTYYDCGAAETDPVPIGRPVDNTQIHIVDKNLKPVPVGIQGQIAIAGTNVGEGYINDSEKTAAVFVDNPFGSGKLYLTGDLGYWREDGNIIYSGRNDFQIKLHGQRIEPGEIESVICSTPGVKEASVCAAGNPDRLIAFYTGNADARAVKTAVRNLLPFYMQPSNYVALDEMPLNSSGKTDKKALKAAAEKTVYEPDEVELPLNETEKAVCTAFSEVLGTDGTGRNQSFYELGGTSLDIVNLLSYDIFKGLTPQDILHASTPAAIAALLTQDRHGSSLLKALYEPDGAETALILFPFAGGDASAFTALTAVFRRKELPVSLYFVDWLKNGTEYERCAEEIQHLAEAKRICFYSHCAGSVIAMKLIERLNTRENTVSLYIAGGNIPPKHRSPVNIWRAVPETALINLLKKAGLPANGITAGELTALIKQFKDNTDTYFDYFNEAHKKISCPVHLVLSKSDPFTRNYKSAEKIWSACCENVASVNYTESDSHYFQSSSPDQLTELLSELIGKQG